MFSAYSILFCVAPGFAFAAIEEDALKELQLSHRHALQSIQTLACRYSAKWEPRSANNTSAQYWREQERVRIISQADHGTTETLADAKRVITLSRRLREITQGTIRPRTSGGITGGDAWSMALLQFCGPKMVPWSLDELLASAHTVQHFKTEAFEGRSLTNLRLRHEMAELEFWFDPQVNYLVRRLDSRIGSADAHSESRVVEFIEASPGIYFPKRVEIRSYKGQQLVSSGLVTFSDIIVNKPISADVFRIRFPRGTAVADKILGKVYTVDEDGHSLGPLLTRNGHEVRLGKTKTPPTSSMPAPTVTQEEPGSWTRWLLPVSIAFILAAAGLWFYRMRRPVSA